METNATYQKGEVYSKESLQNELPLNIIHDHFEPVFMSRTDNMECKETFTVTIKIS